VPVVCAAFLSRLNQPQILGWVVPFFKSVYSSIPQYLKAFSVHLTLRYFFGILHTFCVDVAI